MAARKYSLVNTTVPLNCRLVDFSSTGVPVYAAQFSRLPRHRFEVNVELVGCQITTEPLVRKGTLLMHQLTSKNKDPQVERTVSVRRGFTDLIYDVISGTVSCPVNVGRSIHDALAGASARRNEQVCETVPENFIWRGDRNATPHIETSLDSPCSGVSVKLDNWRDMFS
jgi:hypothetical protein